jgi:hypothetical protein
VFWVITLRHVKTFQLLASADHADADDEIQTKK